jgi:hypothetical protein
MSYLPPMYAVRFVRLRIVFQTRVLTLVIYSIYSIYGCSYWIHITYVTALIRPSCINYTLAILSNNYTFCCPCPIPCFINNNLLVFVRSGELSSPRPMRKYKSIVGYDSCGSQWLVGLSERTMQLSVKCLTWKYAKILSRCISKTARSFRHQLLGCECSIIIFRRVEIR